MVSFDFGAENTAAHDECPHPQTGDFRYSSHPSVWKYIDILRRNHILTTSHSLLCDKPQASQIINRCCRQFAKKKNSYDHFLQRNRNLVRGRNPGAVGNFEKIPRSRFVGVAWKKFKPKRYQFWSNTLYNSFLAHYLTSASKLMSQKAFFKISKGTTSLPVLSYGSPPGPQTCDTSRSARRSGSYGELTIGVIGISIRLKWTPNSWKNHSWPKFYSYAQYACNSFQSI